MVTAGIPSVVPAVVVVDFGAECVDVNSVEVWDVEEVVVSIVVKVNAISSAFVRVVVESAEADVIDVEDMDIVVSVDVDGVAEFVAAATVEDVNESVDEADIVVDSDIEEVEVVSVESSLFVSS